MLDDLAVFDAKNIDDRPAAILFVHFGLGFRCTQAHHGFMASFSSSGSMSSTATPPSAVFGRSAFGIGQPHRGRRGRMDIVRGRSVRSDATAWTMSSCSASGIFAICCDRMRPITTRPGRTYHSTRMLRFRVAFTCRARQNHHHSTQNANRTLATLSATWDCLCRGASRTAVHMSASHQAPDARTVAPQVRVGPMLSKKGFGGKERDLLELLMRFVRGDVRDLIASQENDHGLSYRHHRASQRRSSPKTTICEIFGVVRFSTFSTASARSGRPHFSPRRAFQYDAGHIAQGRSSRRARSGFPENQRALPHHA